MKKRYFSFLFALLFMPAAAMAEIGVTDEVITVGSVLALKGKAQGLGKGMKAGMEAAFAGVKIKGRSIRLLTRNDSYEPKKTSEETKAMIKDGIFVMIGNVGTPTAIVSLPILKDANIPAVGFFTGAGILRPGKGGPILNYRASYIQETAAVISASLKNGLKPSQICAFVQNDGYGMAGLVGVKLALTDGKAGSEILQSLDRIIAMKGKNPKRNNVGPVGVYTRNTISVNPGFNSLKAWEQKTGHQCKLVVTVGAYGTISHFARKANKQGEKWIVSAVSFTGADNLRGDLEKYKATDRIIMTQVVPLLDSNLAIVKEAKGKLGSKFGFVELEGYIVGKMFVEIMNEMNGDITRANFMKTARASRLKLGGKVLDFTKSNQGSNEVITSYLASNGFVETTQEVWKTFIQ